ncbi:hypothetical protein OX284_002270 [Flavobacterium sp. SUN046]|uniref:hypothetical protein n=1 Tax=Flavobacterium sp. SUN046 TaxID=3002440 RepID=UPI002DBE6497|nr:hypothetical protein [Flavobacterium sp. SUN046]MEC4048241.1 hypothetical protein [Flavobacterium sp. SUN046]
MAIDNIPAIHIGKILKSYIDSHRIYKSVIARRIQKKDSEILRYQKRSSIQTNLLLELCHVLKHNFFADIAHLLPLDYSKNTFDDTIKEEEITQLKQQIQLLEKEIAILKEIAINKGK